MTDRRRMLAVMACASLGALVWTGTTAGASSGQAIMKQLLPKHGSRPGGGGSSNLTYHGGPVQIGTTVYLDYWGSAWSTGFSTGGYSSGQAQTYLQGFFSSVGGSSWIGTDTQYCQGVASGTVNCGSSGTHVTNPSGQLAGTWNDTGSVPANGQIQDSDVAAAAVRAVAHFGFHANATYVVLTPSGDSESGFAANGGGWCGWHSDTSSGGNTIDFAYVPYQPDAASSCGENFVNASNNSYGNGYFDGFSIVGGHEYEEAQTDPHLNAWYDRRNNEDADKCAWNALSGDISLGSHSYAVQPVWSNLNNGCVAV